jgi:hypothetical protein
LKLTFSALCIPLLLLQFNPARADHSALRIKATRDYQICQINMQQQRDVKGRLLLDRSYDHYRSIHKKTYAILANALRIMERDLSRNLGSMIAYASIPDFVLEKMDPKPGFYHLAQSMISLRSETRQFLIELGLDANDPLLSKPMISKGDIYQVSSKLKNAPAGSPEWQLGIPLYLSPSLSAGDKLMRHLEQVIVPTEEGFSLHSDAYTSPETTMERIENARAKLLEALGTMDQDLKRWTGWGRGEDEDCLEELKKLQSTPLHE